MKIKEGGLSARIVETSPEFVSILSYRKQGSSEESLFSFFVFCLVLFLFVFWGLREGIKFLSKILVPRPRVGAQGLSDKTPPLTRLLFRGPGCGTTEYN